MYGVRNSTKPMSRNASRSLVSMDSSFLPCGPGWIGLLGESAIVRNSSEPDRNRPHETDDSEADAAYPSTHRVARRIGRRLRSCIPNRWEGSGKLTEAAGRGTAYRNAT